MSSKQPSNITQTTEMKLPAWVEEASKSNYELAKSIAGKPLVQYEGANVADTSGMTTDAYKLLKRNIGAQDPLYKDAYGLYKEAAGPFDPTSYLNPYTAEVEKNAVSNAERSLVAQQQGVTDQARRAGAFGGSRAEVQHGVLGAEGARGIGDLSAELRRAGYDKATADMFSHRTQMQGSAGGILDTAGRRQDSVIKDIAGLTSAGAQEQAHRQSLIDADKDKFYEKRDYDMTRLNTLLAALGMSPHGQTETSHKTGTSESQGTDWATVGLGVMKSLPALVGMLSDRRDKTDIKELGKDPETGLPLYAYRYKEDPKSYPKIVGIMAQDVEKKYPKAVAEVGGHKVVKIGMLAA